MITRSPVCRIPQQQSLFDGYMGYMPSPASSSDSLQTYCQCPDDASTSSRSTTVPVCGAPAVSDMSPSAWEPNILIIPTDQRLVGSRSTGRKKRSAEMTGNVRTDDVDLIYEYVYLINQCVTIII
jgi:hypothetical protein